MYRVSRDEGELRMLTFFYRCFADRYYQPIFVPAHNWLRADDKGNFKKYPNHYHFTAKSEKSKVYRFGTIINTHAVKYPAKAPEILEDGRIKAGGWLISVNLKAEGAPSFSYVVPRTR